MFKKLATIGATAALFAATALPVFAALPGAEVKNENANPNACWGMDRAFYADGSPFKEAGGNMDIKRSFPGGQVGVDRQAWVETYCESHGPVVE